MVTGTERTEFCFSARDGLIMIVGNYGSGKTEISVNLALQLAASGRTVSIADLDIVNPYFRCREAREPMQAAGIRVVVPPGAQASADLPILLPEIKGMLHPAPGEIALFDVGGDPVGARLLSSLRPHLADAPYALWQVINSRRPFTGTVEGCLKMREGIEQASRLKVTGLIANSHLIEETTPEVVLEGYRLASEVGQASGLPVVFVTVMEGLAGATALDDLPVPRLVLRRLMLPPWIQREAAGSSTDDAVPAARCVPLGRRVRS